MTMHRLQISSFQILCFHLPRVFVLNIFILIFYSFVCWFFFRCAYIQSVGRVGWVLHLRKNAGLRRQAASHLQHPRGPAEVSRLLSVSEARVWSVDMEEMSLMEGEGGRLSLLFTAAPALRESTAARGLQRKRVPAKTGAQKQL